MADLTDSAEELDCSRESRVRAKAGGMGYSVHKSLTHSGEGVSPRDEI